MKQTCGNCENCCERPLMEEEARWCEHGEKTNFCASYKNARSQFPYDVQRFMMPEMIISKEYSALMCTHFRNKKKV